LSTAYNISCRTRRTIILSLAKTKPLKLNRKHFSEELQKIDDVKAAITQLAVTTADVKQGVDTLVTAENEKIFRWLAAADSASNHEAARKKWQPDTGLWLTGNSDYIRWRDETSPMLWLYGIRMFTPHSLLTLNGH
jgi:hypothetical protein